MLGMTPETMSRIRAK